MTMKNWKNWAIAILLIIAAVLLWLWLGNRNAASDQSKEISILKGEVTRYKNEAGTWLSQIEGTEAAYDEVYAELSKMKKDLEKNGIDTKNLKSVSKLRIFIHDTVRLEPVFIPEDNTAITLPEVDENGIAIAQDGIEEKKPVSFEYKDEWADIKLTENLWWWSLEYKVRDSVTLVVTEKQRPIRPDLFTITSYSSNSNVVIEGIDYLEIKPKEQRFGFGPQAGVGFNGKNFSPYVGIGCHYTLIKF